MGDRLPADHNYRLYSALIEGSPQLKEVSWQLGTITGIPDRAGWVKLGRQSVLSVRCQLPMLELFGVLDGQVLRIGQSLIQLSEMVGRSLQPMDVLSARIVTIKTDYRCRVEPFEFGVALGKQLRDLGIETMPILGDRCTVRIKDTTVVGYAVRFAGLRPQESLLLQTHGLGGRRRMGCGVFYG